MACAAQGACRSQRLAHIVRRSGFAIQGVAKDGGRVVVAWCPAFLRRKICRDLVGGLPGLLEVRPSGTCEPQ
eukprot:12669942-Alexandrium_andersonii.AAC.1